MWKSGAEWQQLAGRRSGLKPCGGQKWVNVWLVGGGVTVMLIQSDIYRETDSLRWEQTDREVEMASNLCEEVVPQNVVQVWSVLWDLGKQVGD